MGRKRRKIVVTVTETWTFVFDEAGDMSASLLDLPALASIPAPPPDDTLFLPDALDAPVVDAPESSSTDGEGA
ncbi:MAG: hypothetical protein KJZ95_23560 [Caldilinea sp.]|nr:hypothetical protein [Caldilinea sp.]